VIYDTAAKRKNMIETYSDTFSTVEINYTYYKLPTKEELFKLQ
jgi:uncharacterized protein YecE (DUF72 family)